MSAPPSPACRPLQEEDYTLTDEEASDEEGEAKKEGEGTEKKDDGEGTSGPPPKKAKTETD